MPKETQNLTREEYARERVKCIKDFYEHLGIYVIVIGMLLGLNFLFTGGAPWALAVAFFWGIGLAFHAFDVFVEGRFLGPEWEERKMQEILGEKRKRKNEESYFIDEVDA